MCSALAYAVLVPVLLVATAAVASSWRPIEWSSTETLPLSYKGVKRLYHTLLPPHYSAQHQHRFPAIVMLHGWGNNASVFAATQNLTQYGRVRGYVIIYAEGIPDPASEYPTHERSWNAGCGPVPCVHVMATL